MENEKYIKPDCFGYKEIKTKLNSMKTCTALTEMLCKNKECPFYKDQETYNNTAGKLRYKQNME